MVKVDLSSLSILRAAAAAELVSSGGREEGNKLAALRACNIFFSFLWEKGEICRVSRPGGR